MKLDHVMAVIAAARKLDRECRGSGIERTREAAGLEGELAYALDMLDGLMPDSVKRKGPGSCNCGDSFCNDCNGASRLEALSR